MRYSVAWWDITAPSVAGTRGNRKSSGSGLMLKYLMTCADCKHCAVSDDLRVHGAKVYTCEIYKGYEVKPEAPACVTFDKRN